MLSQHYYLSTWTPQKREGERELELWGERKKDRVREIENGREREFEIWGER